MLRNQQQNKQLLKYLLPNTQQQIIQQCNTILRSKSTDVIRQGRIMGKLFNHRVSGSKKRFFPSTTDSTQAANSTIIFKESQFGKPTKRDCKNATRRMSVLNKLFMEHITDLMATGEISDRILGKGLQILRVKISVDFAYVTVFWTSSGEACNDTLIEQELQRCSGLLRHALSQLCLMGAVPRIKFVKDKFLTNMNQVENLLKNMDFEEEEVEQQEKDYQNSYMAETLKQVFYGSKTSDITAIEQQEIKDNETLEILDVNVPEMRHDVFGLNHKDVMFKILTKMRKSKQAWDQHLQSTSPPESNNSNTIENSSTIPSASFSQLARINEKLAEAEANSEKFKAFLTQRKEKRNTPERKKFRASDHKMNEANTLDEDYYSEITLSKQQLKFFEAEDYLLEDMEDRQHK